MHGRDSLQNVEETSLCRRQVLREGKRRVTWADQRLVYLHLWSRLFEVWAALEKSAGTIASLSSQLSFTWLQKNWFNSVCVESSSISFTSIRLFKGNNRLNLYFGKSFTRLDFLFLPIPSLDSFSFSPNLIYRVLTSLPTFQGFFLRSVMKQKQNEIPCIVSRLRPWQVLHEKRSQYWSELNWEKRKEDGCKWIEVGRDGKYQGIEWEEWDHKLRWRDFSHLLQFIFGSKLKLKV